MPYAGFWDFADKNPGWTLLFGIWIVVPMIQAVGSSCLPLLLPCVLHVHHKITRQSSRDSIFTGFRHFSTGPLNIKSLICRSSSSLIGTQTSGPNRKHRSHKSKSQRTQENRVSSEVIGRLQLALSQRRLGIPNKTYKRCG